MPEIHELESALVFNNPDNSSSVATAFSSQEGSDLQSQACVEGEESIIAFNLFQRLIQEWAHGDEETQNYALNCLESLAQIQVPRQDDTIALRDIAVKKRKKPTVGAPVYCRFKKQGEIHLAIPQESRRRRAHVCLTPEQRRHVLEELKQKTPEERIDIFGSRFRFFGVSGRTARTIWSQRDQMNAGYGRIGRPPVLPDSRLNELYADSCVRHDAGAAFSPSSLREAVTKAAQQSAAENNLPPPGPRTIDNYIATLKQMGLKVAKKPQRRSNVRVASTSDASVVTHEVAEDLMLLLHQEKKTPVAQKESPLLCYCKKDKSGKMIGCDGGSQNCPGGGWYHISCINMPEKEFLELATSNQGWVCSGCS